MQQLLRAVALGTAVLIAQLGHLVPVHATAATHLPATPPIPVADDPHQLRDDQMAGRLAIEKARRDRASAQVALPFTAGPAPAVRQAAPVKYSGTIPQVIQQAFSPLGSAAVSWAERVAMCESGDNPGAVNRSSGAAGLFQILPSTWAGTPYASQSEFDPVANAKAAAWIYAHRGGSAWTCS